MYIYGVTNKKYILSTFMKNYFKLYMEISIPKVW